MENQAYDSVSGVCLLNTVSLFGSATKLLSSQQGKARGKYAPLIVKSIEEARDQVDSGFEKERPRIEQMLLNKRAYDGDFDELLSIMSDGRIPRKAWRYVMLMDRSVSVLSKYLYKTPPRRQIVGNPFATSYIENTYRQRGVDSMLQMADRMTYVTDSTAIEVYPLFDAGPGEPPVQFRVWDSTEFVPMFAPGNTMAPVAVATFTEYDENSYEVRLYTKESIETYQVVEEKATLVDYGENYFGVIPFAFFHYRPPYSHFWSGGIGKALRDMNEHVVRRITDLADYSQNLKPKGFVRNVPPSWTVPPAQRPDEYVTLPNSFNAQGDGPQAEIGWITPDLNFIGIDWDDLERWVALGLEMLGVPPSAVRMEQQGGSSGIAIQSEQLPLIEEAEVRQRPFERYETELIRVTLLVCAAQEMMRGDSVTSIALQTSAENLSVSFMWPPMTKNRPGPDRDAHDAFLLQTQQKSRIEILMANENLTEEEAAIRVEKTLRQLNGEQSIIDQAALNYQRMQLDLEAAYAPEPQDQEEPKASEESE